MHQLLTRLTALCLMIVACARPGEAQQTTLVSVDSAGNQTPVFINSFDPAISNDGRYVAFVSIANNLAPGTNGNFNKVYLHDRLSGQTTLVSVSSTGVQGQGNSQRPVLAGGGQFVAFDSSAGNLVPGDTNGAGDIFVHDRNTGFTVRVSVSSAGQQTFSASSRPAISAGAQFVSFESVANDLVLGDTNGVVDIFVHDLATHETARVSVGLGGEASASSINSAISANGRFVAFESNAADLVAGDTNGVSDIFVHDRATGLTERISVGMGGANADFGSLNATISGDGRFVAFESDATNLVPGDTNRSAGFSGRDVFVYDRDTGLTERVSVDSAGNQNNVSSNNAAVSADGRHVAFVSLGSLVAGDTNLFPDIFVHDRVSRETTRVSVDSGGAQSNGGSSFPVISDSGGFVAFQSQATNLVPVDVNSAADIFVHDRGMLNRPPTALVRDVTVSAGTACAANASIDDASIDPDGDAITLVQTPSGPFPLGVTQVTLTVTDSHGASAQAMATVTVIDDMPPTVTAPPVVNATTGGPGSSAAGALVSDAVLGMAIASDNCSVAITRAGVPLGNFFPVGTTTLTYTAADPSGNSEVATQDVIVVDDTPPVVNVPANMTVNATSPAGASVNYAAIATDNVAVASFSCVPDSGSIFPVGTTTVDCVANDAAGNTTAASFQVRVSSAADLIVQLIERLRGMPLPPRLRAQLLLVLQTVLANPQNLATACRALDVLIALVRSQAGRAIPVATADLIIADATAIRVVLGCP
jgi:Tol biopolymer transport system component